MGRRKSRVVYVGKLGIGGDFPISVQSMTKTDTRDAGATLAQIERLARAGCEVCRVAVPDDEAAEAFGRIRGKSPLPLVADIHFDWRLALACMGSGADKVRINPGNIGGDERIAAIGREAGARGISVRVGVNSGSLPRAAMRRHGGATARAMVDTALGTCGVLERAGLSSIVVSLKASDVPRTVEAYRLIADECDYPLHVGLTEAGPAWSGSIRSAVALALLVGQGIGDTIRVSLSTDPALEVRAGYEILSSLGVRRRGVTVISCPTCGRCKVNVEAMATQVQEQLKDVSAPISVAVMGCIVNGPGEAAEADVGVAAGQRSGVLFSKGNRIRRIRPEEFVSVLVEEARRLAGGREG